MTVAICCVTPEGVVLGSDSTASVMVAGGGFHHLNHHQKLFRIGESGSLGALTWGLTELGGISHRTQFALLADDLDTAPASSVEEVANRLLDRLWPQYTAAHATEIARFRLLHTRKKYNKDATNSNGMRSKDEEVEYNQLSTGLLVGFCVAGYYSTDRIPHAFEFRFEPLEDKPTPVAVTMGNARCWATPKIFGRLVSGIDPELKQEIIRSKKWNGTEADLEKLMAKYQLYNPRLPIRDAIDFVYSCIFSTIKIIKSSYLPQLCGGPIELAVITTDREFRWVRHKDWHAAIEEGATR